MIKKVVLLVVSSVFRFFHLMVFPRFRTSEEIVKMLILFVTVQRL